MPRHRLAARAVAEASWPRRAVRFRLPDPAQTRCEIARWPVRHGSGFHRPARVVRGLPAGRRLDRPRPDFGPVCGRGPYPVGLLAGAGQRRADHRFDRQVRDRVHAHDEGRAGVGSAAGNEAVYGRAVGGDRSAGRPDRHGPCRRGRAAHDGGRADFRFGRRSRRGGVEYRRRFPAGKAREAQARREPAGQTQGALRPQGPAALRPGQVVPGRAAAALVVVSFLEEGQGARLAGCEAACRRVGQLRCERRDVEDIPLCAGLEVVPRFALRLPGVRGRLVLPLEGTQASHQCRPVQLQARQRPGTRAPRQGVHAGTRQGGRPRAAGAAQRYAGSPLAERAVVPAGRAVLPDPRRFAAGPAPAARLAALGLEFRLPVDPPDRPDAALRAAAGLEPDRTALRIA